MNKIIKSAIVAVLAVSLIGCGSKPQKPTLANQQSKEDAYEYLTEVKLIAETESKSGIERKDFLVYLPDSKNLDTYGDTEAYSDLNGIYIDVSVNDYFYEEGAYADDVLEYDYEDVPETYRLLRTEKLSDLIVDEKREFAYFSTVGIKEGYSGDAEAYYHYFAAKEVSQKERVLIEIEVELSECNKLTEAVMLEIEEYYGIDVDFDYSELIAIQDEFNANPPATKVYDGYGYTFEIPYSYQIDYSNSNASEEEYAFGPNGLSTTNNDNLQVLLLSDEAKPFTSEELKEMAGSILASDNGGMVQILDADFTAEGKSLIKCTISINNEASVGYFVSINEYVFYFAIHSDSTELPQAAVEIIQTAINTLETGY